MRWTTKGANVQVDNLKLWCCTITLAELLEGWPLGVEATFMVVDSNVDGAARWGRRIRQNSIRNCFHDGIIDVILNISWDRRGFMQIDYVCWNFKFRWKRRCRKREELLSSPPRCPRNRRSISTVFNASKTDEESGFKVLFLLRVSWLPHRTGTFHQKRNDRRKFLEDSDIIQISWLLRESDRSWLLGLR